MRDRTDRWVRREQPEKRDEVSLVCVGDNVADHYPHKGYLYPGGSAYNVAALARRAGLEAAYLGTMGTDKPGEYLYSVLKEEGVDVSRVKRLAGKNAYSRVLLKDGEREILGVDKGVYRKFILEEEDLSYIRDFNFIHTTTYSYTEVYLKSFRKTGALISFDYSFRHEPFYLERTAPYINLAFFSGAALKGSRREFMKDVSRLGPEYVFVTLGREGALLYCKGKFYAQQGFPVEVVDTLGAGDALIAGFISAHYQEGLPPAPALEKAVRAGAEACLTFGGIGRGIPFDPDASRI